MGTGLRVGGVPLMGVDVEAVSVFGIRMIRVQLAARVQLVAWVGLVVGVQLVAWARVRSAARVRLVVLVQPVVMVQPVALVQSAVGVQLVHVEGEGEDVVVVAVAAAAVVLEGLVVAVVSVPCSCNVLSPELFSTQVVSSHLLDGTVPQNTVTPWAWQSLYS